MPVSLQNLLNIGQLKAHPPDATEVQRLPAAAGRNLADSRVTAISPETRFDAAYKAVMQTALAALMAHRYWPDTNRPGHHVTVVQGLTLTIGLAPTTQQPHHHHPPQPIPRTPRKTPRLRWSGVASGAVGLRFVGNGQNVYAAEVTQAA